LVVIELVQSSVLIAVVWLLVGRFGAVSAGIAWLAGVGASQILSVAYVSRLLPKPFAGLGGPVLMILTVSTLGGIIAWGVVQIVPGIVGLAAAGLLSSAVIGLLLWRFDRYYAFGLGRDLVHAFPQLSRVLRQAPADS
jgi:O-antigen/teichoic acid export membrane protein